ncbi:hypothetical protein PENTCL1PPCAC_15473, partial [Pristionchus entomophagus]
RTLSHLAYPSLPKCYSLYLSSARYSSMCTMAATHLLTSQPNLPCPRTNSPTSHSELAERDGFWAASDSRSGRTAASPIIRHLPLPRQGVWCCWQDAVRGRLGGRNGRSAQGLPTRDKACLPGLPAE